MLGRELQDVSTPVSVSICNLLRLPDSVCLMVLKRVPLLAVLKGRGVGEVDVLRGENLGLSCS